jgi:CubicO group peptidase (beta-lactamase class C family)
MRMFRPFAPLAALALSTVAPAATAQSSDVAALIARIEGPQSPNRQGFDALTITELMQRFRVPGVSIAVIKNSQIHWAKGYGVADVETGQPVDTGTAFQAASISKPVFAMMVVKLAQDGRLSLDADVNTYLKSWKVPDSELTRSQPVTLRSLLSHTSGSDDGFGFPGYDPNAPRPTLLNGERPSNVGAVRFGRPPYAGHKYSGGGTELAQLAVTDLIGRPMADLMREHVLAPLGMSNSSYEQPMADAFTARAARAHNGAGRRAGPAPWSIRSRRRPACGRRRATWPDSRSKCSARIAARRAPSSPRPRRARC